MSKKNFSEKSLVKSVMVKGGLSMDTKGIEKARELLQRLEIKTCKSTIVIARRVLNAQEFLTETRKQIEITA